MPTPKDALTKVTKRLKDVVKRPPEKEKGKS